MTRLLFSVFIISLIIPVVACAETKTVYADHRYVMGDNDSKNDARRICFLEAKRKALEKAGVYIQSLSKTANYQLTKDEVTSYSSALLKVEIIKEDWQTSGENFAVFLQVKADVDMDDINNQLSQIQKDSDLQKKIKDQQKQLDDLEKKIHSLQKKLGTADPAKAGDLRRERDKVFNNIERIWSSSLFDFWKK